MKNCFNCNQEIGEEFLFCPSCLTQLKCKNCDNYLMKNAIGCIFCGTPKIQNITNNIELNQIEFEQKGDNKRFKATFSDNVGSEIVSTFGNIIGAPARKKISHFQPIPINAVNDTSQIIDYQDVEVVDDDDLIGALNNVFKKDGENLIFQNLNFKANNKINKQIRIALLTLLGYKYLFQSEEVKRSVLTTMLNHFKLNDGTFRSWIGRSVEIGKKSGNLIFLTPDGNAIAINILKEMLDPNITNGKIEFSKSKSGSKKKTNDAVRKSSNGPKPIIDELIKEDFFKERRTLSDIVKYIKDNKAQTFSTSDFSGLMGTLVNKKILNREKNSFGNYEYFL